MKYIFFFLSSTPVTTKRHLMMADVDEGLFSGCVDADIKERKRKKMEAGKMLKMKINQIREYS